MVDLRNSESLKTNHFVCICQTFHTKIIQKINIYLDLRILDCDVSETPSNYAYCAILSLTHFGNYFAGSLQFLKVRFQCKKKIEKNSWNWLILLLFHEFVWPAGFINLNSGLNFLKYSPTWYDSSEDSLDLVFVTNLQSRFLTFLQS